MSLFQGVAAEVCPDLRKVEISGIPAEWDDGLISMLYKNKRRSGGGNIQHMERNQDKQTACITFENQRGLYSPER